MSDPAAIFSILTLFLTFVVAMTMILQGTRAADKQANPDLSLETRKLYLAGAIVAALCAGFTIAMGMCFFADGSKAEIGKEVFDQAKIVIPPIVTLILGYYFGSAKHGRFSNNNTGNS
jgi:hypothetical protein